MCNLLSVYCIYVYIFLYTVEIQASFTIYDGIMKTSFLIAIRQKIYNDAM